MDDESNSSLRSSGGRSGAGDSLRRERRRNRNAFRYSALSLHSLVPDSNYPQMAMTMNCSRKVSTSGPWRSLRLPGSTGRAMAIEHRRLTALRLRTLARSNGNRVFAMKSRSRRLFCSFLQNMS
jgi:hypothetical protein